LRNVRAQAGISREELAERCGVTPSGLARAEQGLTDPRLSFVRTVADGLGVRVSFLFLQRARIGPPPPSASPAEARRAWREIRVSLRELYEAGELHPVMANELKITRVQLQTQLHQLFKEGMPKR
jgi:transcriptional regulator with XRE-family HTH domain